MKRALLILIVTAAATMGWAQEKDRLLSTTTEEQLEDLATASTAEPADDGLLQQLEYFKKHPLNINTATAEELQLLTILSALQVEALLSYRKLLGKLVNRYELQAIPGWDIFTIKRIAPYIVVADDKTIAESLHDRWWGGNKMLVLRYGRVLEKAKGYAPPATAGSNHYLGTRDKLFARYTYNYKNLLQWGLLADKDAGEQFFKGSQRQGFDFYSFHFFLRQLGIIKSMAIGDFTVNFGQGLLQWQSLAFKKNADMMAIKRQSPVLRPYAAAGEYNFQRGLGITLQKRNWQATFFGSFKKISGNTITDSATGDSFAAAVLNSGYHRTAAENQDRNSLRQTAAGGNLQYQSARWHLGISTVYYRFSKPLQKSASAYNLFSINGSDFLNTGIDYSYTWRNIHLFGELAADKHLRKAFVQGALISLDAKVDVSLLYRNISRAYQSVNANAFTENTLPANEEGLYAGISLRPFTAIKLDAYADLFRFPWLKYRVNAPSQGKEYFVQATYIPNKSVACYIRYSNGTKMLNSAGNVVTAPAVVVKEDLRLQTNFNIHPVLTISSRVELNRYNDGATENGHGFLAFTEVACSPLVKKWNAGMRFTWFETSGYNERIYTYENNLPYSFAIPFYYDKGVRYYINLGRNGYPLGRRGKKQWGTLDIALHWGQAIYPGKTSIGSGLDEINGNHRSELALQCIFRN